ncbi:MAG: hypothetical protein A2Y62_20225 [Candidatus Fischerbacteria bacterium RBG_13_37_8]|uniref:Phosphohistidine phosphatase SixA n=1 Tax=Candidatus Fischerbacteria bacterium RBG_13_37_8 TaxID=1817863 RepID=A0A1F5VFC5_9BACT|nr:MAG: hypothetical protein A2Y62_20225 [Candidatus Fischerbacteria bacterium RBG_13_37_8]
METKTIYLVRHGRAERKVLTVPDLQRSLIKKGKKESKKAAKRFKEQSIALDILISSPANRALETAHIFAKEFEYPVEKIVIEEVLSQDPSQEDMLKIIKELDDACSTVMLFGHNPFFLDLASYLVKDFQDDIPKSGIVGIMFDKSSWAMITAGEGTLVLYDYPGYRAYLRKKKKETLVSNLHNCIENELSKTDESSVAAMEKTITKAVQDIVKRFIRVTKAKQKKAKSEE